MNDETSDFEKCIICQTTDKQNSLVKKPKLSSLKALKEALEKRYMYKDTSITLLHQRLSKYSAEDLEEKSARYHGGCYKSNTHVKTITQAQKRFDESLQGKTSTTKAFVGRPGKRSSDIVVESVSKRLRSSSGAIYNKDLCVLCQEERPKSSLHTVEFLEMGTRMFEVARNLSDKTLFIRLNSISAANDGIANDVRYHRYCWIDAQRQTDKEQKKQRDGEQDKNKQKLIADIEIIHLVDSEIRSSAVLEMTDINNAYNEFLHGQPVEKDQIKDHKKYLKSLLQNKITEIEFTKPIQKNQSEKVSMVSTKDKAADTTFRATDVDMDILFKAAKIVRSELLNHTKWKFTGSLRTFDYSSSLQSFVKWMIAGPKENIGSNRKTEEIRTVTRSTTQMLISAVKTNDQVTKRKSTTDESSFNRNKETPNTVGLGMYLYQKTRSKDLINNLSKVNVSINYKKCSSLQNQIANHVCKVMDENKGCYMPPEINIKSGERPFFAIDNSDFENDTPDGKGEFHGTGMIVCQRFTEKCQTPLLIERAKTGAPGTKFNEDRFSKVYQCNPPKPPNLIFKSGLDVDMKPLKEFQNENLAWVLRKYRDASTSLDIPTWSAYNSLTTDALPKTTCCSLPLLRGSPTDWSNLYTSLKRVQQINDSIDPTKKTIVSMDLQLYNKCLQLKDNEDIANNFIFRLGELHAVFAMLKVIGKYIESSGLDQLFVEADVYGPVTKGQIIDGKHMKRATEAHIMLYLALCPYYFENAINSNNRLAKPLQEIGRLEGVSKIDHQRAVSIITTNEVSAALDKIDSTLTMQALFYRNYMRMVENLLLFIRASREGQWKLHLASLQYFANLFFAHDQLNYARLTPVYLKEMLTLCSEDVETWKFFEGGNFSVNKNTVPFCAIGVDHAMEQENKSMKIAGGITGITLNQTALDRFVLTAPQISQIVEEFFENNGISDTSNKKHHQLIGSANRRITKNAESLKTTMEKFDLSFEETTCVFNVVTKKVLSPEATTQMLNHEEEGKKLLEEFTTKRLEGNLSVWDKMKKRKLLTFKTTAKSLKKKVNDKMVSLREEKTLITRFLVMARQRPDIDLPILLGNFEFSVIPKSLFDTDGSVLPVIDKSKTKREIEDMIKTKLSNNEELPEEDEHSLTELPTTQEGQYKVAIIDGMAMVNQASFKGLRTCKDFLARFINYLDTSTNGYHEVRLVFDRYITRSLKSRTRDKRTEGVQIRYKVEDDTVVNEKKFLSHIETKADLTKYLSLAAIKHFEKRKVMFGGVERAMGFVVVYDTISISNLQGYSTNMLTHDHEEADTLILLHALDVCTRDPFSRVDIFSPDTDVFLLLIHKYDQLCADSNFVTGSKDGHKYTPIGKCYEMLGPELCAALIGFHVFTGCDQIGRFNGKSKGTWWQIFLKADADVIKALQALGDNGSTLPTLEVLEGLEKFVIQAYTPSKTKPFASIADLRWHLFSKYSKDASHLPPTLPALKYKVFRSHYIALVFKSCFKSIQNLPDPNGFGWELEDDHLVAITTDELPAPIGLIELSMCSCKQDCSTARCHCRKNKLICTDMCKCSDKCENDGVEDDDEGLVWDESDDEEEEGEYGGE